MYRVRNQLLASARFPLDNDRGIRGRNPLDLLEHRFESRAVANHLLEFALVRRLLTTTESFESSHREPPGARTQSFRLNSPEPLVRFRAGPHRQTAWPETPLRLLLAPAFAFLCRHVR